MSFRELFRYLSGNRKGNDKKNNNRIDFADNLSDDIYTKVAVAFARAKHKNSFFTFKRYLTKDVVLIIYGEQKIVGRKGFVSYWKELYESRERNKNYTYTKVLRNLYCGHTVVWDSPKKGERRVLLFRVEKSKITHAVFVFDNYNPNRKYHFNWNVPKYSIEHLKSGLENPILPKRNYIPCLLCGRSSEELDWFKITTGNVSEKYIGEMSICPHCNQQVEFYYYMSFLRVDEISVCSKQVRVKAKFEGNESNIYSIKGKDFHSCLKYLVKAKEKVKKDVFKVLDELKFRDEYHLLGLDLAQQNSMGDISKFYVFCICENGNDVILVREEDENVIGFLQVGPTAMAAWQIYLLYTASTVLPVYWHGGYIVRKFIFELEDLKAYPMLEGYDFSYLTDSLLPVVAMKGNIAYVKCCYWNEWKGLVRETIKVVFANKGVKSVRLVEEKPLFLYDCGVCF